MGEQVTPNRPKAKSLTGIVVSDKMDKTVVVAVASSKQHRLYGKTLRRTTRYKAHDPNNVCKLGDTVRMVETRPISKEKRWRVQEILQHKEVAEVQPSVIGAEVEGRIQAPDAETTTAAPAETETSEAEA
jgi:small subunit ribosomal protein S17